jgi:hypothetical protein
MKFKQHIPRYAYGFKAHEEDFNSLNELLNINIVKKFKSQEGFYQYSLTEDRMLMAEYEKGYRWTVIGFIDNPVEGLPKWIAKYE